MEAELDQRGFAFIPQLVDAQLCKELARQLSDDHVPSARTQAGVRHLIDSPAVMHLLENDALRMLVCGLFANDAFAFKATLFDKHTDANWSVAWHQDTSIPVKCKVNSPRWSRWTLKDHIDYALPPIDVLENIVAVRIHLDDCDARNGALRVREGSHRMGLLSSATSADESAAHRDVLIEGVAGSALLMRPMLVHASSRATSDASSVRRRRVLHLEFADHDLPDGAEWARRIAI
jgi:ectoine hydroxylase-related dioxygenase (phytanoyl-CoA dioxygenase family)